MGASKSECPEDIVGVPNESPQHMLLWCVDYFELKATDTCRLKRNFYLPLTTYENFN